MPETKTDNTLTPDRAKRKANQHWDMAGLAAQDGDEPAVARHTETARKYDAIARGECVPGKRGSCEHTKGEECTKPK